MLSRIVFLFIVTTALLLGESNTTSKDAVARELKSASTPRNNNVLAETNTSKAINTAVVSDENSSVKMIPKEDTNSTLDLLENYNGLTVSGTLQSEPEIVDTNARTEDTNNSDLISTTTKLDDVSNLDIVKAQRKQRKIERAEKKDIPDDQSHPLVDTIVVKGSVLQGQIDQLTSEFISFKLIYGEGSIRIKYSDVESLVSEHEYHIYFDGKETLGYITEIQDHAFLKIRHGEVEELVTIDKIDRFIISEDEDTSFENRFRNTFPYLSGNMDLGIEYENSTNVKHKVKLNGHVERKKTVYRTIFDVTYSYETTKTLDTPTVLNKDEFYSFLEQDYALSTANLLFVETGYDFDIPRGVEDRFYPSTGYGYRLQEDKKRWVQFKIGGGYVYERFIDDPIFNIVPDDLRNSYVSGFFGIDGEYELRDLIILSRVLLGGNFFYMPSLTDFGGDWLLRYSISASIPFSKALSLKTVARQVSDDNPSPDVGNNKLTFDLYLSLNF